MLCRSCCHLALLTAALTMLAACSGPRQAQTAEAPSQEEETRAGASSDDDPSDLEALYWQRQEAARQSYTEADVNFMTGMIKHHAQALVMSRMAPKNDASRQIQTLAGRIINAQEDEINSMQRWLRQRGEPVPEVEVEGTRLRVDGMKVHGMNMVGVLTQEQIDELNAARGDAFDRLFLEYMIQHHSGAVTMVDRLVRTEGAARDNAAFKLASDINVDQKTEIARMRSILETLPAAGSTP